MSTKREIERRIKELQEKYDKMSKKIAIEAYDKESNKKLYASRKIADICIRIKI